MKQFNLNTWLINESCKVVTRDGREVDLFYSPTSRIPLLGRTSDNEIHQYTEDGFQNETMNQAKNDLFFADEEEKLTEFEKTMIQFSHERNSLIQFEHTTEEINAHLYLYSEKLLNLARKEILKDLPKWRKATKCKEFDKHVCVMDYYTFPFLDTEVNEGDYYIKLEDLKTLPKEE